MLKKFISFQKFVKDFKANEKEFTQELKKRLFDIFSGVKFFSVYDAQNVIFLNDVKEGCCFAFLDDQNIIPLSQVLKVGYDDKDIFQAALLSVSGNFINGEARFINQASDNPFGSKNQTKRIKFNTFFEDNIDAFLPKVQINGPFVGVTISFINYYDQACKWFIPGVIDVDYRAIFGQGVVRTIKENYKYIIKNKL